MEWLDLLKDCVTDSVLAQYESVFYLNSAALITEAELDKKVADGKLNQFLQHEDIDETRDLLDFFWMRNEGKSDVYVILSPEDLWEEERLFKIYETVTEDFENVPTLEQLK